MKTRLLIVTLAMFTLLYALPPLSAEDAPACDLATVTNVIDVYASALAKLKDSGETDPVKLAGELEDLALGAARLRATCDGLAFSGKSQKLLGPIDFPVGTYRAVLKTEGYGIVTVTPAGGQCGQGQYMSSSLFLIVSGGAKDGAETMFVSQECTAMIEISNVQGDWSLDFENLTTGK